MALNASANVGGTLAHRVELAPEVEQLAMIGLAVWAAVQLLKIWKGGNR